MKIGSAADLPHVSPTLTPAQAPAAPATPAAPAAAAANVTTVELSSAAATLRATAASPEFDAQKVARISTAISEGRFQVNPGVIADKLISNARELLSRDS